MKTLIVFYSRTGTTKIVAEKLAKILHAAIEEVKDKKNRKGPIGYVGAGRDAMKKSLTRIETTKSKAEDYDLVIIGTPIWAWTISTPIRTYLTENKCRFKRLGFFCTMGSSDPKPIFREMAGIAKKPIAAMGLTAKHVLKENIEKEVNAFAKKLQKNNDHEKASGTHK